MMLDGFRQELVKALDAPCMLRVCREDDCLFVTDFPGRFPERAGEKKTALEEAGFDVRPSGRLWWIDPGRAMWDAFIESFPREELPDPMDVPLPLYSLARRLTGKPVPAAIQPLVPLRILLKAADAGDAEKVIRLLPPVLSACLREKKPLPEAAGWVLCRALNRHLF